MSGTTISCTMTIGGTLTKGTFPMSADGAAPPFAGNRIPIAIEEEMKSAFMDYAMSVIVSRALPDARDGLKPVHRRILYTQQQ